MNLTKTVSEILGKKVTIQEAKEFADKNFRVLASYIRNCHLPDAKEIAEKHDFIGQDIIDLMLDALTESNFHSEKKAIESALETLKSEENRPIFSSDVEVSYLETYKTRLADHIELNRAHKWKVSQQRDPELVRYFEGKEIAYTEIHNMVLRDLKNLDK